MAEHPLDSLTSALRLTPSTSRARSQSPRRPRSPERRNQFLALELDPLLSNLSPQSTLRALSVADAVPSNGKTPTDALTRSIANASTLERAFGIRAALAGQKIREWYTEVLSWSWPSKQEAGLGKGFLSPSTSPAGVPESQPSYLGSLPVEVVEQYETRIEEIRDDMDALDVEALKEHVLNVHIPSRSRPISSQSTMSIEITQLSYVQLSDFTAVVTATILQALPVLSRLNHLLSTWDVRLTVLRQVPDLLQGLNDVQSSTNTALARLQRGMLPGIDDRLFSKESFSVARRALERKVLTLAAQMDRILDELEGRPDSLPENWIDDMEAIETDFATWASQAQKMASENDWKRTFQSQVLSTPKPRASTSFQPDAASVNLSSESPHPLETPTQADYHRIPNKMIAAPSDCVVTPLPAKTRQPTQNKNDYAPAARAVVAHTKPYDAALVNNNPSAKPNAPKPSSHLSKEEQPSYDSSTTLSQPIENGDKPRFQPATSKAENRTRPSNDSLLNLSCVVASSTSHTELENTRTVENTCKSDMSDSPSSIVTLRVGDGENNHSASKPCTPSSEKSVRRSKSLPLEQYIDTRNSPTSNDNTESQISIVPQIDETAVNPTTLPLTVKASTRSTSSFNAPKDKPTTRQIPKSLRDQHGNRTRHDSTSDDTSSSSPYSPYFPNSPRGSTPSIQETSRPSSPMLPTPPNSSQPLTPSTTYRHVVPSKAIKSTSYQPYITPNKTPQDNLERKISSILTTIPGHIQLSSTPINPNGVNAASNLQVEQRSNRERSPSPSSTRPTTPTTTLTLTPAYHRPKRRLRSEDENPVRLYHLHRGGKLPPLKLFVRVVGEEGERVMVRVGGGWADLGEYLREYVMHHGRRKMSESKLEVHEVPNASPPYRSSPPHRSPGRTINNGRTTPVSRPGSPFDCRPPSPLAIRKTRLSNASGAARPTLTAANVEKASRAAEPGYIFLPRRRLSISSTASMLANSTPLGLAGPTPKSRNVAISPESEAWVEDMMGQARKTSETLRSKLSTGSLRGYRPSPMAENAPQFKGRLDAGTRRVSDFTGPPSSTGGPANKRVFLKGMSKGKP